jgi:four helix bundle protein
MRNFKKYLVWQKGMSLAKEVYKISKAMPSEEKFGLCTQITRAAISIPSNLAEGCGRGSDKEFRRFVEIALGSAYELETQLLLIQELELSKKEMKDVLELVLEVQKMLQALVKTLK